MSEATSNDASSYRVKFSREQFLDLVDIAKPKIIYRGKRRITSSPSTQHTADIFGLIAHFAGTLSV
jgi:hypothetical protein